MSAVFVIHLRRAPYWDGTSSLRIGSVDVSRGKDLPSQAARLSWSLQVLSIGMIRFVMSLAYSRFLFQGPRDLQLALNPIRWGGLHTWSLVSGWIRILEWILRTLKHSWRCFVRRLPQITSVHRQVGKDRCKRLGRTPYFVWPYVPSSVPFTVNLGMC